MIKLTAVTTSGQTVEVVASPTEDLQSLLNKGWQIVHDSGLFFVLVKEESDLPAHMLPLGVTKQRRVDI